MDIWRRAKSIAAPEEGADIGIFDYGPPRRELNEATEFKPTRMSYGRYVSAVKYIMQLPPLKMGQESASNF
eukprot:3640609-Lingulodinium_polyedra.AAC.1